MIGWQDSAMRMIDVLDVLEAETGQQGALAGGCLASSEV